MKNSFDHIGTAIWSLMIHTGCRFRRKALFIGGIVFIFITQSLMAAGTIKGRVFDRGTKDALPCANVLVKGTSIGAAADLNGVYTISNAPTGEQTIVVSYIGYVSMSVVVTVPEGGTVQKDFGLQAVAIKGEAVVITGQAAGQVAAINQQISANTIKNVVSSSKIHELPDDNAATALSRLPGLSLMEGDKVVIRGVEAKMNVVLVNGIQLPSTDMEDRSTNLGFISSNMLSGIEVTKVVTPDMDANAIGGVVNLRLREAPTGLHFDVLSQGSYNTQDRTYLGQNYKFWTSISNRFFNDKLGVFVQGNASRYDGGNDIATTSYESMGVGGDLGYGQATYGMSDFVYADEVNIVEDYGGSLILDYVFPQGKLALQNTGAFTNNDLTRHREFFRLPDRRRYTVSRDIHDKVLFVNALQGKFLFEDLKVDAGLSHSYSGKNTDLRYGDASETEFGFVNQTSTDPAIDFNEAERLQLTPEDIYNLDLYENNWKDAKILQDGVTRTETFVQHLYNAKLDLSLPISLTDDVSANFKFGGKIKHSTRDNNIEATHARLTEPTTANRAAADFLESIGADPTMDLQFSDFRDNNYNRGDYYQIGNYDMEYVINTDYMDEYFRLAPFGWPLKRFVSGSRRDDFKGKETFTAGYVMGDFNIGSRLTLLTGVRYEHFNMNYNANFVFVTHPEDGVAVLFDTLNTVNRNDDDWFPNVQLRYKVTDWFDVRTAYSKNISRPDYHVILPNIYVQDANTGQAGNPYLKPAVSNNLDLYLSFYNNQIGLFTVGGFYKEIDNIFYETDLLNRTISSHNIAFPDSSVFETLDIKPCSPSATITSYVNNPNPAFIRGLEMEWQTNFWYLPKPLNAMVLNVNYTRVWSEMDYKQTFIKSKRERVNGRTVTTYSEIDTVRNARLLYQGDHTLNIALGVDYKGFSGRISFNLQGDVITSVAARPEEDAYTGNVYKWDYTLQQKLPIEGLSVSLSGVNIFNDPIKNYQKFRRSVNVDNEGQITSGPILENLTSTTYTPRRFEIGLRYNF